MEHEDVSSYTWSLQTNGEKSEGYIMSSVRDNSELKSKDKGFGKVEQRNFTEGRGKIWTYFCLDLKSTLVYFALY